MSDSAFSREHSVARHRIEYWRKRLNEGRRKRPTPSGFVAVRVTEPSYDATAAQHVELLLPSGRRLAFRGAWTAKDVAVFINALETSA